MTTNSRFKKEVRARMEVDGVPYMEARRRILEERPAPEQELPEYASPPQAIQGVDALTRPFLAPAGEQAP